MSALKQEIIDLLNRLPEEATIDDVMEKLYFKAQVDQGLKDLDEGRHHTLEQVENRLSEWLEK